MSGTVEHMSRFKSTNYDIHVTKWLRGWIPVVPTETVVRPHRLWGPGALREVL